MKAEDFNKYLEKNILEIEKDLTRIFDSYSGTNSLTHHFLDLHLGIEQVIEQYINSFCSSPMKFNNDFSFSQKITIAKSLGSFRLFDRITGTISYINKTRNKMAHTPGFTIKDENINEIWKMFYDNKRGKKIIGISLNNKEPNDLSAEQKLLYLKYMIVLNIRIISELRLKTE